MNIRINYGIKTGCNEAFIINESKRQELLANCKDADERARTDKLIRPILRGRDIERNKIHWANLYVIATHNGYTKTNGQFIQRIDINDYPALKDWFDNGNWNKKPQDGNNSERLRQRTDKGDTFYNLRDCAYMDDFDKRKIIWSDIATEPKFVEDNNGAIMNNTCYMMIGGPDYLIDYLNSDIIAWYFPRVLATDLGVGSRYFKQFVEKIPIPSSFENDFYDSFELSKDEIAFISSSVKPKSE